MKRIEAILRIDVPWPRWVLGHHAAQIMFNESAAPQVGSAWRMDTHPVFQERPECVVFSRSERRSTVIIGDGKKTIGEAWLRLAISPRGSRRFKEWFCEMYVYRRGWRDELTAEMDGEKPGSFVVPSCCNDMTCRFRVKENRLVLLDGAFAVELRRSL